MRFQCPRCQAWQNAPNAPEDAGSHKGAESEQTCSACGALITLRRDDANNPLHWIAERAEETAVSLPSEGAVRELLREADELTPALRTERLTSSYAQIASFTACLSPRLWGPATLLVATGLLVALGVTLVGQRIDPALSLLLAPAAVGVVAWAMALSATAVAQLVHLRAVGTPAGMGRSVRLLFEHGSGAAGSALRVTVLGVTGSSLFFAFTLLGAAPGLEGGSGLAVTGGLLWLQLASVLLSMLLLLGTGMALLLHPGMAATRDVNAPDMFRFLLHTFRHEGRALIGPAARPLGGAALLLTSTVGLLALALHVVAALNARLLGTGWAELVSASPIRVLFGAPELVDPSASLGWGGLGLALSVLGIAAGILGLLSAYLGVSGYLLGHALHLDARVRKFAKRGT